MKRFVTFLLATLMCLAIPVNASAVEPIEAPPNELAIIQGTFVDSAVYNEKAIPKEVALYSYLRALGYSLEDVSPRLRPEICPVTGEPHDFFSLHNRGFSVFAHGAGVDGVHCIAYRTDFVECNYCKGTDLIGDGEDLTHVTFSDECNNFLVEYFANGVSFEKKYWD